MPKYLEDWRQKILLTDGTSKCNKVHLAVGWQDRGYWLEWKWTRPDGQVSFKFSPEGNWVESKCFDDVWRSMHG